MNICAGDMVVTATGRQFLAEGDVIEIFSSRPQLPQWAKRRWWQDGDIAIFQWVCRILGREFWTFKSRHTISKISGTTLTLG